MGYKVILNYGDKYTALKGSSLSILEIIKLRFQFSPSHTFKSQKQSEYSFSIFEVRVTLGFKSENFLIFFFLHLNIIFMNPVRENSCIYLWSIIPFLRNRQFMDIHVFKTSLSLTLSSTKSPMKKPITLKVFLLLITNVFIL